MHARRRAALGTSLALLAMGAGCASAPAAQTSHEDAPADTREATQDESPASEAEGEPPYITPHLTWVIQDSGGAPLLCLGPHPRPAPTQCGGVTLVGWDWDAVSGDERDGSVRRGEYIVAGDYSASDNALTVAFASAEGPEPPRRTVCPDGSAPLAWHERPVFDEIASPFVAETFGIVVPVGYSDECGELTIAVGYDDGSIRAALDEEFGAGATHVDSALVREG